MNVMNVKTTCLSLLAGAALALAVPAHAQENGSGTAAEIDKWVADVKFLFLPSPLQSDESNAAVVQGYFNKTPGFPLWLMMDMGGALPVDKDHFSVNSAEKDEDGVWVLDLSCVDSVNGFFKLNFAIDPEKGDAALKVATAADGDIAMYQGKIGSYEGPGMPDFRNEKKAEEAERTAAVLDRIVPALNFTVKLNSELYGKKSQVVVRPGNVQAWSPRKFDADGYTVVCCEKQNGVWYVRLQVGEPTAVSEAMYLDLAIDSWTGDTNFRLGLADKLRHNWRAIVDGQVQMPE